MAVEAGDRGQGATLDLDDRNSQARGVEDETLQRLAALRHDEQAAGRAAGDERLLDRTTACDELLALADQVGWRDAGPVGIRGPRVGLAPRSIAAAARSVGAPAGPVAEPAGRTLRSIGLRTGRAGSIGPERRPVGAIARLLASLPETLRRAVWRVPGTRSRPAVRPAIERRARPESARPARPRGAWSRSIRSRSAGPRSSRSFPALSSARFAWPRAGPLSVGRPGVTRPWPTERGPRGTGEAIAGTGSVALERAPPTESSGAVRRSLAAWSERPFIAVTTVVAVRTGAAGATTEAEARARSAIRWPIIAPWSEGLAARIAATCPTPSTRPTGSAAARSCAGCPAPAGASPASIRAA